MAVYHSGTCLDPSTAHVTLSVPAASVYIMPNDSSSCPVNINTQCKDLSSFIFESNLTYPLILSLLFLPGYHYLEVGLWIRHSKHISMAPFTGNNGTDEVQMICLLGSYIVFEMVLFVNVDTIAFQLCGSRHGALHLGLVQHSVIANNKWNGSHNSAIVIQSSKAIIVDCRITIMLCSKCVGGGLVAVKSQILLTVIQGNALLPQGMGGGLYLNKANLSLCGNLTLIRNTTEYGGGI